MLEKLSVVGLLLIIATFARFYSTAPEISRLEIECPPPAIEIEVSPEQKAKTQQTGKVNFKGVSFNYDPKVFGEVKVSEVDEYFLENETDRPDGVEPRHLSFKFDLSTHFSDTRIQIYPIQDFPKMYAVDKESVETMEKEIKDFKKVLKDKNYRVKGEIPYLRFVDASQSFQAKVRHSKFQSGKGIFFLTHWDTDVALISNEHLRYTFEGLTNDGKYYVLAEMPASVSFLPNSPPDEFDGFKESDLYEGYRENKIAIKRYKKYISSITKRLNNLPSDKYEPSLKHFEELISSLKIEK